MGEERPQSERMEAWNELKNRDFKGQNCETEKQEDQFGWRMKGTIVFLLFKISELITKAVIS